LTAWTVLLVMVLSPSGARAADPCRKKGPDCFADHASSLLAEGEARQALDYLKERKGAIAGHSRAVLVMSQAYLGVGNKVWARRILTRFLAAHEDDCAVRGHLAWLALQEADYRGAREVLGHEGCPVTAPQKTRWLLLTAMSEEEGGDLSAAAVLLDEAAGQEEIYDEDGQFLSWLSRRVRPLRTPPLEMALTLSTGWTSNPLLGSPLDPQSAGEDYASAKSEGDLWAKAATPRLGPARLYLEGMAKHQYLLADIASDLSYAGWGLRPGLELEWLSVALRGAYHYDSLLIAASEAHHEGGHLFFEGHRGEFEVETALGLTVFGGAGRRTFSSMGRTRWEADGGLGGGVHVGHGVHLIGALTGRQQWATSDAYNLVGATVLGAVSVPLPARFTLRGSVMGGLDYFPDSAGSVAFHSAEARRDIQLRGRLSIFAPPLVRGLQLGVTYEPVRRLSTAELYDFMDHGVLVVVGWRGSAEAWGPSQAKGREGRYPIDFGLGGRGMADERLQDLLRQDEEAQRGSSCLN